jgi:hypothetical protein
VNSPGGYSTLYTLLEQLKETVDEDWAFFFDWLLGDPWGANLRNDVSHGLPAPINATYAALLLRAVCLLAVVAGPITSVRPDATQRRDRAQLLAALTDLTVDAGPAGNRIGTAITVIEGFVWRLRLRRLRHLRRRNRN